MNFLKRIFGKRPQDKKAGISLANQSNEAFENAVNGHIKSMIEISFEYIAWNDIEIDSIHILCSTEESIYFHFFYSIGGQAISRHEVNEHLINQCDVSGDQQIAADEVGINDLQEIIKLFRDNNKQVPTRIKITYFPNTKKMESGFSYENSLIGTDLMEEDLLDSWMQEITKGNIK